MRDTDTLIRNRLNEKTLKTNPDTGEVFILRGIVNPQWKKLRCGIDEDGYIRTGLRYKNQLKTGIGVHRIVWMEANGNIPSDMVIDHINNIPSDNRLINLQLLTPANNLRKERKLSFEIVNDIRNKYLTEKCTQTKLAKEYNITLSSVHNILKNEIYYDPNFDVQK